MKVATLNGDVKSIKLYNYSNNDKITIVQYEKELNSDTFREVDCKYINGHQVSSFNYTSNNRYSIRQSRNKRRINHFDEEFRLFDKFLYYKSCHEFHFNHSSHVLSLIMNS